MKSYLSVFLLSIFFIPSAFSNSKLTKIRNLIDLYRPHAIKKYGRPLHFTVEPRQELNAYAVPYEGRLAIFEGALRVIPEDGVLATMCHELGHLFGDTRFRLDPNNAFSGIIEAESDYFAGFCLVNYYRSVEKMSQIRAVEMALRTASIEARYFAQKRLEAEAAYGHRYGETHFNRGVDTDYPALECRLLSVIHGIRGFKRPSCWFNP